MNRQSRSRSIQVGDTVCDFRSLLNSIACFTGEVQQVQATVIKLISLGQTTLAEIDWQNNDTPSRVNVQNLSKATEKGIIE